MMSFSGGEADSLAFTMHSGMRMEHIEHIIRKQDP